MDDIPEFVQSAIEDVKKKLSNEHREEAELALKYSWGNGGLAMAVPTSKYRYHANWKQIEGVWLASVMVVVEEARATCLERLNKQVAEFA